MANRNFLNERKSADDSASDSYSLIEDMDGLVYYAGHIEPGLTKRLLQIGSDGINYRVTYRSVRLANNEPAWEFQRIRRPRK